jgi:hypothetical protein
MILSLWDHMLRLWQYRNNALHEDDSTRVAQFKIEALDGDIVRLAARHDDDLQSKLHEVQESHMERWENIQTLKHNSRQCWASLANCISTKPIIESKRTRIFWSSIYRDASVLDSQ